MPPEVAPALDASTAPAMAKQPAVPGLQPVPALAPDAVPAEVVPSVMETSQPSQVEVPMEVAPSEAPVVPIIPEVATASEDATALPQQPAVSAPELEMEQDKAGELAGSTLVLLVDFTLSLDDFRCIFVVGCL